jgi:uncharacterized protein YjbI with pentapeptide repeats
VGSNLKRANLKRANLIGAILTENNLLSASLEETILPNGSRGNLLS